jgi:hypothetical protein
MNKALVREQGRKIEQLATIVLVGQRKLDLWRQRNLAKKKNMTTAKEKETCACEHERQRNEK